MQSLEVLQQLFYIDKALHRIDGKENLTEEQGNELIRKLKNATESLSIQQIESKVCLEDIKWFNRFKGVQYWFIEADLGSLCIDRWHTNSKFHGVIVKRGMKLADIVKNGEDDRTKLLMECNFFDALIYELPIIVRPYGSLLEVLLGNHRSFALIKKGVKKARVICVDESFPE